jgi:hypothetical protein
MAEKAKKKTVKAAAKPKAEKPVKSSPIRRQIAW